MARKKDERSVSRAASEKKEKLRKMKAMKEDENYDNFDIQLRKLGLQLREISGDGNCLFRALGDQLEGHGRGHLRHRQDVVKYMFDHRQDFEPFVEDDIPFNQYLECLGSPGTYAGNDAIVAFARLHKLTVIIHQFNSPIWEIHGCEKDKNAMQIHISYHNGDHYSSVRRLGDLSEAPSNIKILKGELIEPSPVESYLNDVNSDGSEDSVLTCLRKAAVSCGCYDDELLKLLLEENFGDFEGTLAALRRIMSANSSLSGSSYHSANDSDSSASTPSQDCNQLHEHNGSNIPHVAGAKAKKSSSNHKKRERKLEKKLRATERQRTRLRVGDQLNGTGSMVNETEPQDDDQVITVISSNFRVLQI